MRQEMKGRLDGGLNGKAGGGVLGLSGDVIVVVDVVIGVKSTDERQINSQA